MTGYRGSDARAWELRPYAALFVSTGERTRTVDLRIMRPLATAAHQHEIQGSTHIGRDLAHHFPTDTCQTDPDLAELIREWSTLSAAQRAAILAIVRGG